MNRWHSLPAEVFAIVERTPGAVLLDCGKPVTPVSGAWTQLFLAPREICVARAPDELPSLFQQVERAVASGLVAAGFFAYECATAFEPRSLAIPAAPGQPLAWFGIYDRAYRFDHSSGSFLDIPPGLDQFELSARPATEAVFSIDEPDYARRIAAIHSYIRSGDIYQLNFTAPVSIRTSGSPAALYAQLRRCQPVEFGAFLHCEPGQHILSLSPELFFRIDEHRRITARPMKGTAPRGRTTREDRGRAVWLAHDPKNRAENLMIVDLIRNDLGRIAEFGSVHVEDLFAVERYPTLWQMTSTVTAQLRPQTRSYDVFRALFPCGSITGAPKVRAMQLIAQLEGHPRGVYTGAIGFFSRERTVFNVAIRTLELSEGLGSMGVGGGIVIDSNAADEFRECQLKAAFLTPSDSLSAPVIPSPDQFQLIETMLCHNGYPLLGLHLDRLADSADYFGFPCDRAAVQAALEARANTFADVPRRVRFLLHSSGEFEITDAPLSPSPAIARVRIAAERINAADPMLFHKTTHRFVYTPAYTQAVADGYDDVLFFNQRGELTEGAISNVFVEIDGRLFTPPVECGLLAGVYRRHILETNSSAEERILTVDDLRRANAVYLTNAVRALRHASIRALSIQV
jgi:para-aminobenzoate synthetase / 4-amino-4-deoxychorismate lyase